MLQNKIFPIQIGILVLGMMAFVRPAAADKERDFNNALKSRGCGYLPYARLQSRCRSEQDQVYKWCKSKLRVCKGPLGKRQVRERLENGRRCVLHRKNVASVFREAKFKLGRETSKRIKPMAERLASKIVEEERGHAIAIGQAEDAMRKCEQMLSRRPGPRRGIRRR